MNILLLDTAHDHCSVGLWNKQQTFVSDTEVLARGHAETLVPKIKRLMQEQSYSWQDVNLIAVTSGPGSFTGLRVGIAAARGLGLALGIPVVGVNSFDVYAQFAQESLGEGTHIHILLDARRRDFFYQSFDGAGQALLAPQAMMSDAVLLALEETPGIIVGNGYKRFHSTTPHSSAISYHDIDPTLFLRTLAAKALQIYQQDAENVSCEPYYLCAPGVTVANG